MEASGDHEPRDSAAETLVRQSALRLWLWIIPLALVLTDAFIVATHARVNARALFDSNFAVVACSLMISPWFARYTTLRISNSGVAGVSVWMTRVELRWSDDCHFRVRRLMGVRYFEVYSAKSRWSAVVPLFALDRRSVSDAVRKHLPEGHPLLNEVSSLLNALEQRSTGG